MTPTPPPSPWPRLLAAAILSAVLTALVWYGRGGC